MASSIEIRLRPATFITGTLRDESAGRAVAGGRVALRVPSNAERDTFETAIADAKGHFAFDAVPSRSYSLFALHPAYSFEQVLIAAGESSDRVMVAHPMARLRGRVWLVRPDTPPTVEVRFDRSPELIQRRQHIRIDAEVPLTAWSLLEATRLLSGTTVNLGGGGALIRLPDLPAAAALLDVTLTLPDGPLALRAQVVRRGEGDLVGLSLADISKEQEDRLTSFVLERFE